MAEPFGKMRSLLSRIHNRWQYGRDEKRIRLGGFECGQHELLIDAFWFGDGDDGIVPARDGQVRIYRTLRGGRLLCGEAARREKDQEAHDDTPGGSHYTLRR